MSSIKILSYVVSVVLLLLTGSVYFSPKHTSNRDLVSMLEQGHVDLIVINNYLMHHQHDVDTLYDTALQLAALHDVKYLDEVVNYYTHGSLILNLSTADNILAQLPAESIAMNHSAGRIYATEEFGHYNAEKAVQHLEYAALRGDKNAAESLSIIYARANCFAEAITWAKVANSREITSECSKLPVDISQLTDEEWDIVVHNENALEKPHKMNSVSKLKYSSNCIFHKKHKQPLQH